MWETYRQMAYLYFPNAIVSIDSFHVIQDIERYVDKIRISIMNRYDKKSDQYYLLKEFGWLTKIKFSKLPNKEAKFNHRFNKYLTYSDFFNMIMELSNGSVKGRNSTIKTIKKISNRITNFNRFRNRIMSVINKDFYFNTNKKEIKK